MADEMLRFKVAMMTFWKDIEKTREGNLSRKRAPLSSAEVLVYQFNSLSFDSISVRVGENEALVPYY